MVISKLARKVMTKKIARLNGFAIDEANWWLMSSEKNDMFQTGFGRKALVLKIKFTVSFKKTTFNLKQMAFSLKKFYSL